jgi:hypothetical protein
MPAMLKLDEFGSQVWHVFGGPPYHVGSSVEGKGWRDVDVRVILMDDEWEAWGLGDPTNPNAKWVALCWAFAEMGKAMTGLPIDFQIQQATEANRRFPTKGHPRSALGCVDLRRARPALNKDTPNQGGGDVL